MKQYKEIIIYGIFLAVMLVWMLISLKPKVVQYITEYKEIKTKTVEVADLERKLETLRAADMEKKSQITTAAKKIFIPDEAGLDTEATFANIFDDVIQMAKHNGLRTRSIEYTYNPPDDNFVKGAPEKYNVCQLNMSMVGDYSDFEGFFQEIYKYPYLVGLYEIVIRPYSRDKKILLVAVKLKLYSQKEGAEVPAAQ